MQAKMSALVSVLMPVYNAEQFLSKAIDSILSQTHTDLELLIIDDASTDSSLRILNSYKDRRVTISTNSKNIGYLKTCNKLFSMASGDYITFQDADDYSDISRIKKQLKAFESDSALGICGTFIYRTNENGKIIQLETKPATNKEIKIEQIQRSAFCGATIMIPKKVLTEVGAYRQYFDRKGSEDYDWSMRIVEKYKAVNLKEGLYYYRQHTMAVSKNIDPLKRISGKMVQFLGAERAQGELDSLANGNHDLIKQKEERLLTPYRQDASLVFVEYASWFNYNQMYSNAIKSAWRAVLISPFKLNNFRTLLYCIRVYLTQHVRNSRNCQV